jgi:hypothetical protein
MSRERRRQRRRVAMWRSEVVVKGVGLWNLSKLFLGQKIRFFENLTLSENSHINPSHYLSLTLSVNKTLSLPWVSQTFCFLSMAPLLLQFFGQLQNHQWKQSEIQPHKHLRRGATAVAQFQPFHQRSASLQETRFYEKNKKIIKKGNQDESWGP